MLQPALPELEALLTEQGLPHSLLEEKRVEGEMEAEAYGRLFMALIKRLQRDLHQDPNPILDLSSYRLMFAYILQADHLQGALERAAAHYLRFQPEQQSFSLDCEGDQVHWRFHFNAFDEDQTQTAGLEHFSMSTLNWMPGLNGRMISLYTWHRIASWLIGNFIDLSAVRLDYPLQGSAEDYIQPFRAPFYFHQDSCTLEFHRRYLELPIVRREADLDRMLETFPAELMRADEMTDSSAARVRGLLGDDYSTLMPSLEQVARRLHTTTATLHRRLRSEGTSYQQIKDACRRDAAIALLRAGSNSGSTIAERLGFSDASTFYRAFKKWTGLTPQEFRNRES